MNFETQRPSRRDFVRIGGLTALGLGLGDFGRLASAAGARATARHCVLIWLDGGPSHLETFDLKPAAPAEVRGPFQPISTSVPGVSICELMPRLARRMEHVAVMRSVTSPLGEHNLGTHYLLTGYKPTPVLEYPSIGSVVAHLRDQRSVLPGHIAIPQFRVGGGRMTGAGFLPASARPFSLGGDPSKPNFRVRDLDFYPGLDRARLDRRKAFLAKLDEVDDALSAGGSRNPALDQAYALLTSPRAKRAFDLSEETPETRRRYGFKTIGQSCLLARRLVERGVPFVTVNNTGWDTHNDAYTRLKEGFTGARVPVGLIPSLDTALSAMMDDLQQRDLLDETLIIVMGEFGRTPKLNTAGGRDHWPRVFSVAMVGGGVAGGQVIGASDSVGESPHERPVTPADLACTIYHVLGIDPASSLETPDGRPVKLSQDGEVISELFS